MRRAIIFFSFLIGSAATGFAESFPQPSYELCQIYRQGPVMHQKIPIYYGRPTEDPKTFYWQDIWFRPEYLSNPALEGLVRPDGLPERDLLFALDIDTGQPLPLNFRRSLSPKDDNLFTLLLSGGVQDLDISRLISIFANAPTDSEWQRTGVVTGDFELIEVKQSQKVLWHNEKDNIYVAQAPRDEIAVMQCDAEGNYPVPHCSVVEKSEIFEMKYSGLRLNQLEKLVNMRRHAQNFTACLTWKGERKEG